MSRMIGSGHCRDNRIHPRRVPILFFQNHTAILSAFSADPAGSCGDPSLPTAGTVQEGSVTTDLLPLMLPAAFRCGAAVRDLVFHIIAVPRPHRDLPGTDMLPDPPGQAARLTNVQEPAAPVPNAVKPRQLRWLAPLPRGRNVLERPSRLIDRCHSPTPFLFSHYNPFRSRCHMSSM